MGKRLVIDYYITLQPRTRISITEIQCDLWAEYRQRLIHRSYIYQKYEWLATCWLLFPENFSLSPRLHRGVLHSAQRCRHPGPLGHPNEI